MCPGRVTCHPMDNYIRTATFKKTDDLAQRCSLSSYNFFLVLVYMHLIFVNERPTPIQHYHHWRSGGHISNLLKRVVDYKEYSSEVLLLFRQFLRALTMANVEHLMSM